MPRLTESRAQRARLPEPGKRYRFEFCSEIVGFRCRVMASGARSWVVVARLHGKEVSVTLGDVGVLSCDGPNGAAELAKIALTAARRGEDPKQAIGRVKRPQGATLAELWAAYAKAGWPLASGHGFKRASSIKGDAHRWRKHFTRIEHEPAASFDTARTQRWLDGIAGLGARSHALTMLKGLLSFGASRGLCEPHRISLNAKPSRKIENYLKPAELKRLDAALDALSREQPERIMAFSAIRLLLLTGMRKSEALTLTWSMVDLDARVIHLERDKASGDGRGRSVLLSDAACDLLRGLPRLARGGWVFFGRRRIGHIIDIEYPFINALKRAKLRRVRLHDLRHSFAASAVAGGVNLHLIGKLLGHKDAKTTQRYAHISKETERAALDRVVDVLS